MVTVGKIKITKEMAIKELEEMEELRKQLQEKFDVWSRRYGWNVSDDENVPKIIKDSVQNNYNQFFERIVLMSVNIHTMMRDTENVWIEIPDGEEHDHKREAQQRWFK